MLKIWGRTNSSNVQKVLWCADELGLAYERIDIGGQFGGNDQPAYLKLNPNGLVPTVEDGELVLWESNSIVRYLGGRYGAGKIWPTDPGQRARGEMWMDWQLTTMGPPTITLFQGFVRLAPEQRDMAALAKTAQTLGGLWGRLDAHLAGKNFIGGADFSVADIPCAVWIHRWFNLPIERPTQPHLRAWYDRLLQRPGFKKHVALPLS